MNAKHTPSASELGAERLGFGGESLEDALRTIDKLLAVKRWTPDEVNSARTALETINRLADEDEAPIETRAATASEIAGAQMLGGKAASQELARDGVKN